MIFAIIIGAFTLAALISTVTCLTITELLFKA